MLVLERDLHILGQTLHSLKFKKKKKKGDSPDYLLAAHIDVISFLLAEWRYDNQCNCVTSWTADSPCKRSGRDSTRTN